MFENVLPDMFAKQRHRLTFAPTQSDYDDLSFYVPFNIIYVRLRQWKVNNKSHCPMSCHTVLTLKAPITTKADDNFDFLFYFQMKTSLDISCESSAEQTIHKKYQDWFSLKNKKK